MSDELLSSVFAKMQEQGLVDIVFSQEWIDTREQFVALMKAERNIVQFVSDDTGLLAVTWINNISDNFAYAHFCVFREAWGPKAEIIGKKIRDYWFGLGGDNPVLDIIIGMLPKRNRLAHNFVQKIGWTYLGAIPDMFKLRSGRRQPALIYYKSRFDNG